MVSLKTLALDHFMCIEHAEFDFTNNYITVFYGPNGSGKSSIFEAIALCWTERRRGDSYKDFIMHGSEAATVVLTASVHGEPIRFDIEILDKRGLAPFQRTITYKGQKYTNSECTALLSSFDIDYLQHIMFSMQGENNITDLRPAERTKLLKRIFNFEFEAQLSQVDKFVEQEEQNMLVLKTRYDVLSHSKFDYEDEAPTLPHHEVHKAEARIDEINNQLRVAEQRALLQEETVKRLEGIRTAQSAAQARKHAIEEDVNSLSSTISRLQGDKARYAAAITALPDPVKLQTEIEEKKQSIEALTNLVDRNRLLLTERAITLQSWQSDTIELRTHITAHKQGKCPQCGQATHPETVPELETRLVTITTKFEELNTQKVQLEADTRVAERNIIQFQTDIPNLQEKIVQSGAMKTQYQTILKTVEDNITQTQSTLNTRNKSLEEVNKQITEFAGQINEIMPLLTRSIPVDALRTEKDQLVAKLQADNTTRTQNDVVKRKNIETKVREEENKKQLAEINKQQNELLSSINNYKDAKKILEVELPNYIIVKACSKLEKHINHFISEVKPGMVVRLFQARSGVEFFYSPIGEVANPEDWTSTKMASGFERELLSAAWRVALARAYNLSALMLDEVDSAANTFSSEKMFREIANLVGFEQLFIVSHKPEVVDILLQENDRVTAYYASEGTFTRQEY
jgi:chromosome segregation ATPase